MPFGQAHVFYPEASEARCSATLLLDLDQISLVRSDRPMSGDTLALRQYVNDRPYVASSFLSVAISRVFGSALKGVSKDRPELAKQSISLTVVLPTLPCRGGEALLHRLFEPLGYSLRATPLLMDEAWPAWGASPYFDVALTIECPLSTLLSHLYVLLPVLDNEKHYWVGSDELQKLLDFGQDWLATHPERTLITERYLKRQRDMVTEAFTAMDAQPTDPPSSTKSTALEERDLERSISLQEQRIAAVHASLTRLNAKRVIDLGCGEGQLLRALASDKQFTQLSGVDVAPRELERARTRLGLDGPEVRRGLMPVEVFQGALTYTDERFVGYDAACLIEVIEHLDPERLAAMERVVFAVASPDAVIVTTPNVEYNVCFTNLPRGTFRHRDHRFEWDRATFETWAKRVAAAHGYTVQCSPVGPVQANVGAPTQMGVFTR